MVLTIFVDFLFFFLSASVISAIFMESILDTVVVCLPILFLDVYSDLFDKKIPFYIWVLVAVVYNFILLALGI